jgi:hypothetical protein
MQLCKKVSQVLAAVGANRVVVGHTVQVSLLVALQVVPILEAKMQSMITIA